MKISKLLRYASQALVLSSKRSVEPVSPLRNAVERFNKRLHDIGKLTVEPEILDLDEIRTKMEEKWPGITTLNPQADCAHGPNCHAHQMDVVREKYGGAAALSWRHWLT